MNVSLLLKSKDIFFTDLKKKVEAKLATRRSAKILIVFFPEDGEAE